MADSKRIICVTTQHPHRHIVSVGIGNHPAVTTERMTVTQVRAALDRGQVFYTLSPSSGKIAFVHKYKCSCGVLTIKSAADAVQDNNLDNLAVCP